MQYFGAQPSRQQTSRANLETPGEQSRTDGRLAPCFLAGQAGREFQKLLTLTQPPQ